jgi:general transcription factor IIIA
MFFSWLQRAYHCPKDGCGKSYKRLDHLNRHLLLHDKSAGHLCPRPGCVMICSNKANLLRHLRNHDLKGDDLQRSVLQKTINVYKCPEPGCGRSFNYPCRLQCHYELKHGKCCFSPCFFVSYFLNNWLVSLCWNNIGIIE